MFTQRTYYTYTTTPHKDACKKNKNNPLVDRCEHSCDVVLDPDSGSIDSSTIFEGVLTIKRMPKLSEVHNRWAIGQLPNDDYIYISHEVLEEWSSKILHMDQKFYVQYTSGTSSRDDTPWSAVYIQEFNSIHTISESSMDKVHEFDTDKKNICVNCQCYPTSYCGICAKYTACICCCITCNKSSSSELDI